MKLNVNIDHVATLRNARGGSEPDPVRAAQAVERAGAHGITFHLREDRRHIRDEDVERLRRVVKTKMNMEMAATPEMVGIARRLRPEWATLVPEKRRELTTEGGLDVAGRFRTVTKAVHHLQRSGIEVSVFIDPVLRQVRAARASGATMIELHTGAYAGARTVRLKTRCLERLREALEEGNRLGLGVNAGHGLDYRNVRPFVGWPGLRELSIGHSIVSRAVEVGMTRAVRDMLKLLRE